MFRFTTEVKGLAIDFDSFEEPIESWDEIEMTLIACSLPRFPRVKKI